MTHTKPSKIPLDESISFREAATRKKRDFNLGHPASPRRESGVSHGSTQHSPDYSSECLAVSGTVRSGTEDSRPPLAGFQSGCAALTVDGPTDLSVGSRSDKTPPHRRPVPQNSQAHEEASCATGTRPIWPGNPCGPFTLDLLLAWEPWRPSAQEEATFSRASPASR